MLRLALWETIPQPIGTLPYRDDQRRMAIAPQFGGRGIWPVDWGGAVEC